MSKTPPNVISFEELVAELEKRGPVYEDAKSVVELAEAAGRDPAWVRAQLRAGIEAGRVRCVKIQAKRIDGSHYYKPLYRFLKRGKK